MNNEKKNITMAAPFFSFEDRKRIHEEIDTILDGALSMGPQVSNFEKDFAHAMKVKHAIAMNSCTSCLETSLIALGINTGDEIIVTSETFISTGMSILLLGAKPVFAEISPYTLCLDLEDVKKKITPRTKGIIFVYFAGLIPENMQEFVFFCQDKGLFLIEDAAHATGAVLKGHHAGSFGDTGCFSFYPTKVITAGEGGMLTTNNDRIAEVARSLQHRGRDLKSPVEIYIRMGRNVRLSEMNALMGRIQLEHLQEYLLQRRKIAAIYSARFNNEKRIQMILPSETSASTYWKFPIILKNGVNRESLASFLQNKGIATDTAYSPPLHLQPVIRKLLHTTTGLLPLTEDLLTRHLCLPCHPQMTTEDAQFVAEKLIEGLNA